MGAIAPGPASVAGGSGSLPTAAGADEIPASTGAGATYTARTPAQVRTALAVALATAVVLRDGSQALTGDLNADGHTIDDLADPTDPQHPATAAYVDVAARLTRRIPLCDYATNDGVLSAVGRLRFDPADYAISGKTTNLSLVYLADVSDAAVTGSVELYNLTDAATVTTGTTSATSPTSYAIGPLGTPGAAKIYELRLSHDGAPTEYLTVGGAALRITWS